MGVSARRRAWIASAIDREASRERRVYRTIERVMTDVVCAYCLHRLFRYMKRVASMKDSKH